MTPLMRYTEPTLWALRKNAQKRKTAQYEGQDELYEHIFGYDPIKVAIRNFVSKKEQPASETSARNPKLNILDSQTGFAVRALVSEDPADN